MRWKGFDLIDACNRIATDLFGWEDINGVWGWTRKSLSGFKVARSEREDTPGRGFWRPDRSFFQINYVVLPALGRRFSRSGDIIRIGNRAYKIIDKRLKPQELTKWVDQALEPNTELFNYISSIELERQYYGTSDSGN